MSGSRVHGAERLTAAEVERAVEVLAGGGIGAFPTETVYGLGADLFQPRALARVFAVKGRPQFDPLIVHLANADWLPRVVSEVPEVARELAGRFWPGPLTLVLPKREEVSELATAGMPTVGVRVPAHPVTRELLERLQRPLVGPSANLFGQVSPTTAGHVWEQLGEAIDFVLDGGPCRVGVESTVVLVTGAGLSLLRPGGVPLEELRQAVPGVAWLDRGEVTAGAGRGAGLLAPGTLPRHYAPRTPLELVVEGGAIAAAEAWLGRHPGGRVGALTLRGQSATPGLVVEALSGTGDLVEAASQLFAGLHRLDARRLDQLFAERVPVRGLGLAMNDRLERAARRE